ncbi:MAG: hypothetical protein ACOY4I_02285 [Bacillota bacterium]
MGSQDNKNRPKKEDRKKMVLNIVSEHVIKTRRDIEYFLDKQYNVKVDKSTISRDCKELGLVSDETGRLMTRQKLEGDDIDWQRSQLEGLKEVVVSPHEAWTLPVLTVAVEPGFSQAVARQVALAFGSLVVGTVPGENVCLVVARDDAASKLVMKRLTQFWGKGYKGEAPS